MYRKMIPTYLCCMATLLKDLDWPLDQLLSVYSANKSEK